MPSDKLQIAVCRDKRGCCEYFCNASGPHKDFDQVSGTLMFVLQAEPGEDMEKLYGRVWQECKRRGMPDVLVPGNLFELPD